MSTAPKPAWGRRPSGTASLLSVILLLGCMAWMLLTGAGLRSAVLVSAALAVQTLSGALIWRYVTRARPRPAEWAETVGMGLAVGMAMALPAGLLLRPLTSWGWVIPSIAVLGLWLLGRLRSRREFAQLNVVITWRSVIGSGAAILLGLMAAAHNLERYPLTWQGSWSGYHPDMVFFEALSDSLATLPPWESIFVPGSYLHYHWFSFAWSGQLSTSLGLEPFVGLTRMAPFAAAVAAALLAAGWTARRTTSSWAPALAACLITMGGFVGAAYGTLLNIDSPSQAMSVVWLLAATYALLEYLDGNLGVSGLVIGTALTAVAMGCKLTSAVVLVLALGLAAFVGVLMRAQWRVRALTALAASAGASAAVYLLVLAGAAKSGDLMLFTFDHRASSVQGLDLGTGSLGILGGTLILILSILPRWSGVVGLWLDPAIRRSPSGVLSLGFVLAGAVPLLFLSQGVNELWFALAASVPLAVLASEGMDLWWQQWRRPGLLVVCACAGVVVLLVVTLVWSRGESGIVSIRAWGPVLAWILAGGFAWLIARRIPGSKVRTWIVVLCTVLVIASAGARLAPSLGKVGSQSTTSGPAEASIALSTDSATALGSLINSADSAVSTDAAPDYGNEWSPSEVAAARWLRAHTSMDDLIVTDRTSTALVPALAGRRTYLSASPYVVVYADAATSEAAPVYDRISRRFAVSPTSADFEEMCAAGVTYGWFSVGPAASDFPEYYATVLTNDAVRIVRIRTEACEGKAGGEADGG